MTTMPTARATVNGISLQYQHCGEGPVVLLLHGFPDLASTWQSQLDALAAAGFRAVAPDLRGYGESDRPRGVAAYTLDTLAADIAALAAHLGGPVHLVGHDWGGVIAWHVAMHHASAVRSLTIVNAPHPKAFKRELARSWSQRARSWYVLAFQLPVLPELLARLVARRVLTDIHREGAHDADAVTRHLRAFSTPGAWTAAINYYRALLRHPPARPLPVSQPTLVLWGLRDPYLGPALIDGLEKWVPGVVVRPLAQAGHWAQWSAAAEVNEALITFVRAHRD
jgi:pimeloyl-ACP methyl ester carboxylesterase